MQIRVAIQRDIAAVDALLARAYPRLLKADYPPSILVTAIPLISRAQPALITCGTYYVVEQDGRLMGAGGWTKQAPGSKDITSGLGHIRHVVTDDRATRRGIARALLNHIFEQAKTHGLHRLNCMSTLTAEPFYTAMGFTRVGPVLVPLGMAIKFPAVQMERTL